MCACTFAYVCVHANIHAYIYTYTGHGCGQRDRRFCYTVTHSIIIYIYTLTNTHTHTHTQAMGVDSATGKGSSFWFTATFQPGKLPEDNKIQSGANSPAKTCSRTGASMLQAMRSSPLGSIRRADGIVAARAISGRSSPLGSERRADGVLVRRMVSPSSSPLSIIRRPEPIAAPSALKVAGGSVTVTDVQCLSEIAARYRDADFTGRYSPTRNDHYNDQNNSCNAADPDRAGRHSPIISNIRQRSPLRGSPRASNHHATQDQNENINRGRQSPILNNSRQSSPFRNSPRRHIEQHNNHSTQNQDSSIHHRRNSIPGDHNSNSTQNQNERRNSAESELPVTIHDMYFVEADGKEKDSSRDTPEFFSREESRSNVANNNDNIHDGFWRRSVTLVCPNAALRESICRYLDALKSQYRTYDSVSEVSSTLMSPMRGPHSPCAGLEAVKPLFPHCAYDNGAGLVLSSTIEENEPRLVLSSTMAGKDEAIAVAENAGQDTPSNGGQNAPEDGQNALDGGQNAHDEQAGCRHTDMADSKSSVRPEYAPQRLEARKHENVYLNTTDGAQLRRPECSHRLEARRCEYLDSMDSAATGTVCGNVVIVCPPLGRMNSGSARVKDDNRNRDINNNNNDQDSTHMGGSGGVWGSNDLGGGGVRGEHIVRTRSTSNGAKEPEQAAGVGGTNMRRDTHGSYELLIHAWMEEVLDLLDRVPSLYVVVLCPLSYQAEMMPYTCMRSCRILMRPVKLQELLSAVFNETLEFGGNLSLSSSPLAHFNSQMCMPSPFGSVASEKRAAIMSHAVQKQVCICMCVRMRVYVCCMQMCMLSPFGSVVSEKRAAIVKHIMQKQVCISLEILMVSWWCCSSIC